MRKIIKLIFLGTLLLFIYICSSLSPIFFGDYVKNISNDSYIIIGHRGVAELAPENTIASINYAVENKLDRVEVDVQQTLDSTIILMHDITLDRTSNGSGLIKEKTFSEISKLDAGSWFSDKFKNEKIPTLESVLDLINGRCKLIIEIKKGDNFYPNIEKNILDIIVRKRAESWVIIHSFDYEILEKIHNLNPNIPLHKIFLGNFKFTPYIFSNKIEKIDIEKYPFIKEYSLNYCFANRGIINFLKSKGKKINVWTVNNSITANELISIGVDGIITDNLELMKK